MSAGLGLVLQGWGWFCRAGAGSAGLGLGLQGWYLDWGWPCGAGAGLGLQQWGCVTAELGLGLGTQLDLFPAPASPNPASLQTPQRGSAQLYTYPCGPDTTQLLSPAAPASKIPLSSRLKSKCGSIDKMCSQQLAPLLGLGLFALTHRLTIRWARGVADGGCRVYIPPLAGPERDIPCTSFS